MQEAKDPMRTGMSKMHAMRQGGFDLPRLSQGSRRLVPRRNCDGDAKVHRGRSTTGVLTIQEDICCYEADRIRDMCEETPGTAAEEFADEVANAVVDRSCHCVLLPQLRFRSNVSRVRGQQSSGSQ